MSTYDEATAGLLIVALLIVSFNVIWTAISFCACCCDKQFLSVLPITSAISFILILAAIITFGVSVDSNEGENLETFCFLVLLIQMFVSEYKYFLKIAEGSIHMNSLHNGTDVAKLGSDVAHLGLCYFGANFALFLNLLCIIFAAIVSFCRECCCV